MTALPQKAVNGESRGWREPKPPTPSPTFESFTDLDNVPPQAPIDSVTDLDDVPPRALIDNVKRKGKGPHKRTISAAIPSIEEDVAVDDSLRKSARSRKLKMHN